MSFILYSRWLERTVLVILVFINAVMPMQATLKLNYWFATYMAKNPAHAFARNMVSMIEKRKTNG